MGWTDDLSLGIDEIDRQHKILFECLAQLEEAVQGDERWAAVHFALDELRDFARIHFAVEESLMRLHGYPDFEAHIAEHRAFVDELNSLRARSLSADVSGEMVLFLKRWLTDHIGRSDHGYVPHLRTAGITG